MAAVRIILRPVTILALTAAKMRGLQSNAKHKSMNKRSIRKYPYLFVLFVCMTAPLANAQTSVFTFQGRLTDGGNPANANYDLRFSLFNDLDAGEQIGTTQTVSDVPVTGGIFTVQLDFGAASFSGADRFIEISISPAGLNNFTTLVPRQALTSAPYSIQAVNAADSQSLGGVTADQYVQANDSRLSDARMPLPGSSDYLQNTAAPQPGVSFNVGGTGTAGILSAGTQFNLGGNRILSNAGSSNLFMGIAAGAANTTGSSNSFFGHNAGRTNTTGQGNSFFGSGAGDANTTGRDNSFFGLAAGLGNSSGSSNSFFGLLSGSDNTTGGLNSFFGKSAGGTNTTGSANSFFGFGAGLLNTMGFQNTFVGTNAGANIIAGSENTMVGTSAGPNGSATVNQNTFIGSSTGVGNVTGTANTLLGYRANVGVASLTNATAIGYRAQVSEHNSLVLGGIFGINGGVDTNVGIGTTAPQAKLHISGAEEGVRIQGRASGNNNVTYVSFHDSGGTAIGYVGDGSTGDDDVYLTANGTDVHIYTNGAALTVTPSGNLLMSGGPNVLGASVNTYAAQTIDTGNFKGVFTQNLFLSTLDTFLPSAVHVCARIQSIGGTGGQALTRCSSPFSSANDKTDVNQFSGGLDIIRRLKPVSFKWRSDGSEDVGLNAEDVAEVEQVLISRNEKGEVVGVKETSLQVVLINSIKQLEAQVKRQEQEINLLNKTLLQFEALKRSLCRTNSEADICVEEQE